MMLSATRRGFYNFEDINAITNYSYSNLMVHIARKKSVYIIS